MNASFKYTKKFNLTFSQYGLCWNTTPTMCSLKCLPEVHLVKCFYWYLKCFYSKTGINKHICFSSQLLCSTVQKALFEEEERVRTLSQKVRSLEKANGHLREKVKTMKRLLRQAQRETMKEQQTLSFKQLYESKTTQSHPDQDTTQEQKDPPLKKVLSKKLKN